MKKLFLLVICLLIGMLTLPAAGQKLKAGKMARPKASGPKVGTVGKGVKGAVSESSRVKIPDPVRPREGVTAPRAGERANSNASGGRLGERAGHGQVASPSVPKPSVGGKGVAQRGAGVSPESAGTRNIAAGVERTVLDAQRTAPKSMASVEGRTGAAHQPPLTKEGMLKPLGDMTTGEALEVLDSQATTLPIFERGGRGELETAVRRQQGINGRINDVRSSVATSMDAAVEEVGSLRSSVSKHMLDTVGDLEKQVQAIADQTQKLADDSHINESVQKLDSLLDELASPDVSFSEKQKILDEVIWEKEQLNVRLDAYRDKIVPEVGRASKLLDKIKEKRDFSPEAQKIETKVDARLNNAAELLNGDLARLKEWSRESVLESDIGEVIDREARNERITEAGRAK